MVHNCFFNQEVQRYFCVDNSTAARTTDNKNFTSDAGSWTRFPNQVVVMARDAGGIENEYDFKTSECSFSEIKNDEDQCTYTSEPECEADPRCYWKSHSYPACYQKK
jgi:hypothetical protein